MKLLKTYNINEEIYYKIVKDLQARIEVVDDIHNYFYGYFGKKHKQDIVMGERNGTKYLIMLERILALYIDIEAVEWKQVRVALNTDRDHQIVYEKEITPIQCWNELMKVIRTHYKDIDAQLNKFQAEYQSELKQVNIVYNNRFNNTIYEFENCYYYDINGAHCDALCEIFPLCKKQFLSMYDKRKLPGGEKYKKIFNYTVGMLVNRDHRKTYNWIVQRTTKLLRAAMDYCGGEVIYARTDGFIVYNPDNLLEHSKELGNYKLEYSGKVYFYRCKNYFIYQIGDTLKGSCRANARDKIDLANNKVVSYDIKRDYFTLNNGKKTFTEEVTNIKQEIL